MRPAKRDILTLYLLGLVTAGLYLIYWAVQAKEDMNVLGGRIPSAWYILIPGGVIYWAYRFYEAFAIHLRKDGRALAWFLLALLVPWIMPAIVQGELNALADANE
jgi:hypothetical protein